MKQTRLSEADAKKLLDRASELDAERAQSLDPVALREIAAEAGISPAAIDAALAEHLDQKQSSPQPRRMLDKVGLVVMFGVIGLLLAFMLLRLNP